jgi:hypothetical protein
MLCGTRHGWWPGDLKSRYRVSASADHRDLWLAVGRDGVRVPMDGLHIILGLYVAVGPLLLATFRPHAHWRSAGSDRCLHDSVAGIRYFPPGGAHGCRECLAGQHRAAGGKASRVSRSSLALSSSSWSPGDCCATAGAAAAIAGGVFLRQHAGARVRPGSAAAERSAPLARRPATLVALLSGG